MRLWITLGTFLAQPGSYPHKTPPPESCCRRAPHFARAAPHTLQRRKCAPALKKKRLSTQTGVLYYYCYLYIKPLKNNQNPQSGHLSTAGDRSIGRLDNLTDRRLMPEWGSNGSACAVLSGESLTPLEAAKRSCWWGRCLLRRTSGCNASATWGTPFAFSQRRWRCPTGFARTLAAKEKEHGFHSFAIN